MNDDLWDRLAMLDARATEGNLPWYDTLVSARRRWHLAQHGVLGMRLAVLEAFDHYRRRLLHRECLAVVEAFDTGDVHYIIRRLQLALDIITGVSDPPDPTVRQLTLFHPDPGRPF